MSVKNCGSVLEKRMLINLRQLVRGDRMSLYVPKERTSKR